MPSGAPSLTSPDLQPAVPPGGERSTPEPLAPPVPRAELERELEALPADRVLWKGPTVTVVSFHGDEAPSMLHEIGRCRELTFRLANEGTGKALDLDRFDGTYDHLVVWHRDDRALVGAYRLGPADRLVEREGPGALYVHELFALAPAFFDRLHPALELGRSFVVPRYQRSSEALPALWRGIGRYVARSGHRHLYGCVSIDAGYRTASLDLIRATLGAGHRDEGLAGLIRPRLPCPDLATGIEPLAGVHALDRAVADLEPDGRGIPVLLRRYLAFGGRILGFNRDPDFGDVVDGLVVVDLARVSPRRLGRFMGPESAAVLRRLTSMDEEIAGSDGEDRVA